MFSIVQKSEKNNYSSVSRNRFLTDFTRKKWRRKLSKISAGQFCQTKMIWDYLK